MRAVTGSALVLVSALLVSSCGAPAREAAGMSPSAATAAADAVSASPTVTQTDAPSSTPTPTVSESPVAAVQADGVDSVGMPYVARLCIVNNTNGTLTVHWENAEITWRNDDMMGSKATFTLESGVKSCGAGHRITDTPDEPANPMAIDQMNVWATFTSSLQPRATYRAGADNRSKTNALQAGVAETPGIGERVYAFPVGEQRAWVLSETPMVLDRLPNHELRTRWGPMAMFRLTVGRN